jgi:hypothetical protein
MTALVFVMKTNQMHYLSLIYFIIQPLHVSGMYCPSSGGIHCICKAIGTRDMFDWLLA